MIIRTVELSSSRLRGQVQFCFDWLDWRFGVVLHGGYSPSNDMFEKSRYFDCGLYVPLFSIYANFWQPTKRAVHDAAPAAK